jgi:hypothetical protein
VGCAKLELGVDDVEQVSLVENELADAVLTSDPEVRRRIVAKWSAVEFLIALVLFIVASPFVVELEHGQLIEAALLTTMLGSAVLAVSQKRSTRVAAILLVLPAIAGRWINHYRPDLVPVAAYLGAGLLFLAFVLFQYFRYILRAPTVDLAVLCAAVSTYLMLGMFWTMAYVLLTRIRPDSFALNGRPGMPGVVTGFDAFYFSFVTLSTVGYGDIVPASRLARMLAVMEATTGTLYVATLIARLVAIHASSRPTSERAG